MIIRLNISPFLNGYNRELKQRRRGRQRERQKAIDLISKTTTLHVHHASFVHFFAVVARLQRENA